MSNFVGDAVAAEQAMTQGSGFMGKAEDGVIDDKANGFINSEMQTVEGDMGMNNSGMEGMAEKAVDGFVDKEADTEANKLAAEY